MSSFGIPEVEAWEEVLQQHGLGMDVGHNPTWLRYGANYDRKPGAESPTSSKRPTWQDATHERPQEARAAPPPTKRPHKKTAENIHIAKKLLALIESGLSQNAAAKQLGIPKQTASFVLKRHSEVFPWEIVKRNGRWRKPEIGLSK